jgi:hypothetical protein
MSATGVEGVDWVAAERSTDSTTKCKSPKRPHKKGKPNHYFRFPIALLPNSPWIQATVDAPLTHPHVSARLYSMLVAQLPGDELLHARLPVL